MKSEIWKDVTAELQSADGEERYVRHVSPECWVSVLHRLTGFGYMEWETAIGVLHDIGDRKRTWKDSDCLIIHGDRRGELDTMNQEELVSWYHANIEGNQNSIESLLGELSKQVKGKDETSNV